MRAKMERAKRAKQFIPFSALTGLEAAMQERETLRCEQILLGEDAQLELDFRLRRLPPGTEVCAVCYEDGQYRQRRGVFRGKDELDGCLLIGCERVKPEDLLDIEPC